MSNSPQRVSNKGKLLKVLKAELSGLLLLGSSSWEEETGWTGPRTKKKEAEAGWVQVKRQGTKSTAQSGHAGIKAQELMTVPVI